MFADISLLKARKKILDRSKIVAEIAAINDSDLAETAVQDSWKLIFKQALLNGRKEIQARFVDDNDGALAVQGHAFLMDQLLRLIYETFVRYVYPAANPTDGERVALVAVGGYGRGELAPESDVDLLFLHHYKVSPRVEQIVEDILYSLWDLGLKIGYASRSIDECLAQSKKDWTIATSILESRFICGERALFANLSRQFHSQFVTQKGMAFLQAKLQERAKRHHRMGNSRYVLEPNIKDGKGGLRDLHTLYWTARFLYGVKTLDGLAENAILTRREVKNFANAQQFLWKLRCHLHYAARRQEDRLTFDLQPEIADRLGYKDRAGALGVERLMKHYFLIARTVGELTRIFVTCFEADYNRKKRMVKIPSFLKRSVDGFLVEGQRITSRTRQQFADQPLDMLKIFKAALETGLDIHPDALRLITRNLRKITREMMHNPLANRLFIDILTHQKDPELTLRHMNECGLLGKFLPDFGRVVAQMQYDMYHIYTTDEHTIRAIGIVNGIENGRLQEDHPTSSEIITHIIDRRVLYVAVLLHDIAKGRKGDHSILGAEVAHKLCPRLGLDLEQTETVAWLVRFHLLMSETAFHRDLEDPKTITDFVDVVKSPERLKLLLCLTVADIRAVGPKVWNNWKARLLRDLYYRAEDVMFGGLVTEGRENLITHKKSALQKALGGLPKNYVETYIQTLPLSYFLANDLGAMDKHANTAFVADTHKAPIAIDFASEEDNQATCMWVYADDHPSLFACLSGAIALAGASVIDAKIFTCQNGRVFDIFWFQNLDGQAGATLKFQDKLREIIHAVLAGRLILNQEFQKRAKSRLKSRNAYFSVAPRVLFDNKASDTHTVIEVNGLDQDAILYRLTASLNHLGVHIGKAKISTYGEQVVDVFYVKDIFGMKIERKEKKEQIRQELMQILANAPS